MASPAPIDLAELASRISTLGESIKLLKSSDQQSDANDIASAVAALLDAKRTYALNNGGIGVDGKPWEEPLTKSQKKKLEKEKKAAIEAVGKEGGDVEKTNAGKGSEDDSATTSKKAAKKAEAKAKKAALKAAAVASSGDETTPPVPASKGLPVPAAAAVSTKKVTIPSARPVPTAFTTTSKLRTNQISFNPNVSLSDRPVVALTTAILHNSIVDYELVSDHTRCGCALGLPSGKGEVQVR